MVPGAADLLRRLLVREAFHVLVAIHAAHRQPVDRLLHLLRIDGKTDRLAVDLRRQRLVAMAGQAILVLQLLRQ